MTRFARAKGSKSSNERLPEDGTPWNIMQEQLAQAKRDAEHTKLREEADKKRLENYQNFLNDQKTAKKKSTWCEFPEVSLPGVKSKKISEENEKTANLKMNKQNTTESVDKYGKHSKKRKHFDSEIKDNLHFLNDNKTGKKKSTGCEFSELNLPGVKSKKNSEENDKTPKLEMNEQSSTKSLSEYGNHSKKGQHSDSEIYPNSTEKKNNFYEEKLRNRGDQVDYNINQPQIKKGQIKKSKIKVNETSKSPCKKERRKTLNENSFNLIVNGETVLVVNYDGFPIMKKDAERIEDLKRNMLSKGIPYSEVGMTIKLERRRAEKALARLKKEVCFKCRKGGHVLSDCPELQSSEFEEFGSEICFKCGSTEHKQYDCKVRNTQEMKFAKCFICKEQGHIVRECPDNPRGLYPNGGACRLCGDVTHLKKDCPTRTEERETSAVTLDTLADTGDLEGIGYKARSNITQTVEKTPKHILF